MWLADLIVVLALRAKHFQNRSFGLNTALSRELADYIRLKRYRSLWDGLMELPNRRLVVALHEVACRRRR